MTAAKTAQPKDEQKTPGFEKSLERLEKIVSQMESGALTLEQMIAHFEEGQALIKVCSQKLNEVERRIEILVKKGDGVEEQPFDEEDGGGTDPAADGATEKGELF